MTLCTFLKKLCLKQTKNSFRKPTRGITRWNYRQKITVCPSISLKKRGWRSASRPGPQWKYSWGQRNSTRKSSRCSWDDRKGPKFGRDKSSGVAYHWGQWATSKFISKRWWGHFEASSIRTRCFCANSTIRFFGKIAKTIKGS